MIVLIGITPLVGACEPEPVPDELDPRLVEALGLRGDEVVHTVSLGGEGSVERVSPAVVEIAVGEIVEFVTVDRRIHTVTFPEDGLSPQAAEFLRTTRQARSPPLVRLGSRYVVTFENAPPGRYPFLSGGHGEPSSGLILVN